MLSAGASCAGSSGRTSSFSRSQGDHLALASSSLAMVPGMTWGGAARRFSGVLLAPQGSFVVLDASIVSFRALRVGLRRGGGVRRMTMRT